VTAFLPSPLFLVLVLSLATGGWKGFYKWVGEIAVERTDGIFGIGGFFFGGVFLLIAHGALDGSWLASIISPRKRGNVKQESANFYDSRPAHPIFSRMPKNSGIQFGTAMQEGYIVRYKIFSRCQQGRQNCSHTVVQLGACEIARVISCDKIFYPVLRRYSS